MNRRDSVLEPPCSRTGGAAGRRVTQSICIDERQLAGVRIGVTLRHRRVEKVVIMDILALMTIAGMLGTVEVLLFGLASMARDGKVGHLDSEHWMAVRVFLQLTAVVALVATIYVAT